MRVFSFIFILFTKIPFFFVLIINLACRSRVMAAYGIPPMISPPSSISNGPEPPQLPPYPPPLRSTQVLQPLSVFPGWRFFLSFIKICFFFFVNVI